MIHLRKKIRAGVYSVVGTRKATHWASITKAKPGFWPARGRWVAVVQELEDKATDTIKLKAKWGTFPTLKAATQWAKKELHELHKDIPPHLYADLTRPAGAPLD